MKTLSKQFDKGLLLNSKVNVSFVANNKRLAISLIVKRLCIRKTYQNY